MADDSEISPRNLTSGINFSGNAAPRYHYSSSEEGLLFSAVAVGILIGTYPVVKLSTVIGVRSVTLIYGAISVVSTVLLPFFASLGFWWLFLARVLEGLASAAVYPVLGSVTSQWSSLKHSGMYISVLSLNWQLGPMMTMPLSGASCVSSLGWPWAYYFHGIISFVLFAIFYLFYRDSPRMHKNVSAKELTKIEFGKPMICEKKMPPVPYFSILKSIPIWAVWIASIGGTFGFQVFFQYGPIYLNKVLHFEIQKTGFSTALPFVFSMIVKICSGPFSDWAACLSEKARVIMFTVISQGSMAVCFVILALIPESMPTAGQIAYTAAVAFCGMNCVGVVKSAQLVAQQHVHFVMAVMSILSCVTIFILPFVVSTLAPRNLHSEWALIFYIACGLIVVTNGLFIFIGDAKPAPWTKIKTEKNKKNVFSVVPDSISKDKKLEEQNTETTIEENEFVLKV
ncbi:hypothetical protein AB6A40_006502 [Gnathostoma spinigerum]|uniref:Major facilitator superfamily (MFS) profile domain-containing protein n=1 Tax=Gnathostoma spinigerum TaxID=75299 RepID=A0ABD6EIJ4_9BILA